MDKRKLGKTGLEIAPPVFGGTVLDWTPNEPTSFALLDAFMALPQLQRHEQEDHHSDPVRCAARVRPHAGTL